MNQIIFVGSNFQISKKIIVELNEEMVSKIELYINNIRELALNKIPPNPEKNKYCKNCAYNYFCWS